MFVFTIDLCNVQEDCSMWACLGDRVSSIALQGAAVHVMASYITRVLSCWFGGIYSDYAWASIKSIAFQNPIGWAQMDHLGATSLITCTCLMCLGSWISEVRVAFGACMRTVSSEMGCLHGGIQYGRRPMRGVWYFSSCFLHMHCQSSCGSCNQSTNTIPSP